MMRYVVIIPAFNEHAFLPGMLESLVTQTILPDKAVLVDDNSTDTTGDIAKEYSKRYPWFSVVKTSADAVHLPGSKVINAFNFGLSKLDSNFDVIAKLDADLILPADYFEKVLNAFEQDPQTGMAGGFCYVEKNGDWILENLTDKDHIRGALKSYRKTCFDQIGGLKPAMGWDTADELLAKYHGWNVVTLPELKVKHLKPTGANYDRTARFKQGEAFYALGYGFWIAAIASAKLAMMKGKPMLFGDYLRGYFRASLSKAPMLVNNDQAKFIRRLRLQKIKEKIFGGSS